MGYYAKRINEFHVGHWIIGKIQWSINIVILLKLFNAPLYVYILAIPCIFCTVWVMGYFFKRSGLWDGFIKENLGAIRTEKEV